MGFQLLIIFLMLCCNAVLAAYEMALASISLGRLALLVEQKKRGAVEAAFMKGRIEASLAVVQLGITLVGAVAAATGGLGVQDSLAPWLMRVIGANATMAEIISLVCLVIPLSAVTIVFAELVPKVLALQHKEKVCLILSPFMKLLYQVTAPVISIFERVVKAVSRFAGRRMGARPLGEHQEGLSELRAAAGLARSMRLIGKREEKIVLSAAQLAVRSLTEIMLPAGEICTIPLASTLTEALIKAHLEMHTRFPVCEKENDPDTIKGYVNFKDIMSALQLNPQDPSLKGIVRPIPSYSAEMTISQALGLLMQEKSHIALVVSAGQRVQGMITLEDIIEELVGDIEDEFDHLGTHVFAFSGGWIMGGGIPMNTVALSLGISWPQPIGQVKIPTLNEWCAQQLGRIPKASETIQTPQFSVLIRKIRRNKVAEAVVSLQK